MLIDCHFRDCRALLATRPFHVKTLWQVTYFTFYMPVVTFLLLFCPKWAAKCQHCFGDGWVHRCLLGLLEPGGFSHLLRASFPPLYGHWWWACHNNNNNHTGWADLFRLMPAPLATRLHRALTDVFVHLPMHLLCRWKFVVESAMLQSSSSSSLLYLLSSLALLHLVDSLVQQR